MTAENFVQHQRSEGEVRLDIGASGLLRMREAGSAKVRFSAPGREGILINQGGGLAGGDRFTIEIAVQDDAIFRATTQAAERVYRSLGPAASVDASLAALPRSRLHWLPQETILFEGASLERQFTADIAGDASFLAVESVILGREAMGETVRNVHLHDRWRIRRDGRLIFADDLLISGAVPKTAATLNDARGIATVILVSPIADSLVEEARDVIGDAGSASAWSGKLVARLLTRDGFSMRKRLIPLLRLLSQGEDLPKVWSL